MEWRHPNIHPSYSVVSHASPPTLPLHSTFEASHALPHMPPETHMPRWTRWPRSGSTASFARCTSGEQSALISACFWPSAVLCALSFWVSFSLDVPLCWPCASVGGVALHPVSVRSVAAAHRGFGQGLVCAGHVGLWEFGFRVVLTPHRWAFVGVCVWI